MRLRPGLHALVRSTASAPPERRLVAAAMVRLLRQRRRLMGVAAPWLARLPRQTGRFNKLQLWTGLASALVHQPSRFTRASSWRRALEATHAYAAAQRDATTALFTPFGRGRNYAELLRSWCRCPPQRLLIFHHFDQRGFLPTVWRLSLLALQRQGWQVVVSSSNLQPSSIALLQAAGVQVALRANLGLCLGAYRDLVQLLGIKPALLAQIRELVLCNDSTIPLLSEAVLIQHLQDWQDRLGHSSQPSLAGFTDSVQMDQYHLQTYWLYANQALIQSHAWQNFWLNLQLTGSKDELICSGELGLSKTLLLAGVELHAAYPLIQGLIGDPFMRQELLRLGLRQLRDVNQTLTAWQSLLRKGFPFVKKHALFDFVEHQGDPMAMTRLSGWIPEQRRELLVEDLHQLLVSRYLNGGKG